MTRWLQDNPVGVALAAIAGVLAAFLILGEQPVIGQYIGGAVLICGILIGLLASRRRDERV